jgi:hemoglobin-like flavoprotein
MVSSLVENCVAQTKCHWLKGLHSTADIYALYDSIGGRRAMNVQRIGEVWDSLHGRQYQVIEHFYQRFFERFPNYRRFFPDSMDAQMKKMVRTISLVARMADSASVVEPHIERVGDHHKPYSLQREDLDNFKDVFIEVLGEEFGDRWDANCAQAWQQAFDELIIPGMVKGLTST